MNRQSLYAMAAVIAPSLLHTSSTIAADNNFEPRIEIGGAYDSNLRLLAAPLDNEVYGGYADMSAVLVSRTQRTQFSVSPRVLATRYTQGSEENTTDWFLNSSLTHQAERSRYAALASASRQDVIYATLLSPSGGSLGTPGSGDGSIAQIRNKVLLTQFAPSAAFLTGKLSELQLSASYAKADYNESVTLSQVDYSNVSGSVGWSLRTSPRTRLLAAVDVGKFDPDSGGLASNSQGIRVEAWRENSERFKSYIRVGALRTKLEMAALQASEDNEITSLIAGLGVERQFATSRLLFQANRSVDAGGAGQPLERSEGYLEFSQRLSERTQFRLGARAVWAAAVVSSSGYADQRYYVTDANLEWRMRRSLSITAKFEYTNQRYQDVAGTNSTGVQLGLVYQPARAN